MGVVDEDFQYLSEVAQGDEKALVWLMDKHKEALYHFALRYLGNGADAAEITEQTFFRVFKKAHTFKPRSKVKTWIFAIALNLSRDHLRKNGKLRHHLSLNERSDPSEGTPNLLETLDSGEISPADSVNTRITTNLIEQTIRELPEKLRFPFVFCVLEKHSYDNCAAIIRRNRKTVEMRIYRARKILQEKLEGLLADN